MFDASRDTCPLHGPCPLRLGASIVLFVGAALALSSCGARTPAIPAHGDARPVAALERVRLGGLDQSVLMRGRSDTLPVLLWLHGGPGAAQMPARRFNESLEAEFIVVHWDQRGAGRSNPRSFDAATMTFDRFVQDTHELTAYLKERFGQDRIYLLGHSWGTQIGLRVVAERPDDYHAYVGVGQVIDQTAACEVAYAWLADEVETKGSKKDRRRLAELGPPPYPEHDRYVRFAKLVDAHGGNFDVGFGRLAWTALRAPEYTLGDMRRWLRGANRGSGPMWDSPDYKAFDAVAQFPRIEVPVHLLVGRHDWNTPLAPIAAYYEGLDAPAGKRLVVFEHSAHTPFFGEPERFHDAVSAVKLRSTSP